MIPLLGILTRQQLLTCSKDPAFLHPVPFFFIQPISIMRANSNLPQVR
jgi:hypothetical protein